MQSFKAQVHDAASSDAERIAHLNNCLAPEVGAQLGISLRDPGHYRYALQELQATYGSQIVIAKSCSSILRSLKPVQHGDYAGLSKLSAALKSVVATHQLCGFESEQAPNMLSNLVGVKLRFRRSRTGLVADITKIFHQVRVRPEDASAYRYFWREPGSNKLLDFYEFNVHLFGSTGSPAVCCFALQQAVKDSSANWEELLEQVQD